MKFFLSLLLRLFFFLFICHSFNSFAQSELKEIVNGFSKYLEELPQEKIYVHFDQDAYLPGETMWYKVYLTAGPTHIPSVLSLVIYCELLDHEGKQIYAAKHLPLNGSSAGSFRIPDTLSGGNYYFRAYTNWMRNSGDDYIFNKRISVVTSSVSRNIRETDEKITLNFFPEGGDLVYGLASKVGFKILDQDGLGRNLKGKIISGDDEISTFESNEFGMGVFYLTPVNGKKYRAVLDDYGFEFSLPEIRVEGVVIQASYTNDDIILRIQVSNIVKNASIGILAQTRGVVGYSAIANLSSNLAIAKIPKSNLLSGISQITILDNNGIPIAERLVFVDHKDEVQVSIQPDKAVYKPREKVNLILTAKDASEQPVQADLSVAVFDLKKLLTVNSAESIRSYLLLSSELKGHIASPEYYFNKSNDKREEHLDFLLLTQGWRKFTIRQALEKKWKNPEFDLERGLTLSGKLLDPESKKPLKTGKVSFINYFPAFEKREAFIGIDGSFMMSNLSFLTIDNAILKANTKSGGDYVSIQLDKDKPLPFQRNTSSESLKLDDSGVSFFNDFPNDQAITLKGIEVKTNREEERKGSRIYGSGSITKNVSDNMEFHSLTNVLQLLEGRIAGVRVVRSVIGDGESAVNGSAVIIQGPNSINYPGSALLFLDDVPVSLDELANIPVQYIESYTVWKGAEASIFGMRGTNGAVGFFTKKGIASDGDKVVSSISVSERGYNIEREFYSPQYNIRLPEHDLRDRRRTLFWAPLIQTDAEGKATISFYNHDEETSVGVKVEGISSIGNTASGMGDYKIQSN